MNELKLEIGNLPAFENGLQQLGGRMGEPCWYGNWYLRTSPDYVLKIMQFRGSYSLLELRKRGTGFTFLSQTPIADIAPYQLEQAPDHKVLHKTVRPWHVRELSVDVLIFDDIGTFACVNYEDSARERAFNFICKDMQLPNPVFIEVPFIVLKRRKLGLPGFD